MNEIEQKEIEEMARDLRDLETWQTSYEKARILIKRKYRKVSEDSVVLTKEEQDKILKATEHRVKQLKQSINDYKQRYESSEQRYKQLVQTSCEALTKARQEVAREIIEKVDDMVGGKMIAQALREIYEVE